MSDIQDPMCRAIRQTLRDWRSAGLTHLPNSLPPNSPAQSSASGLLEEVAVNYGPTVETMGSTELTDRKQRLEALAQEVSACSRCQELVATRTQTVFGVGSPVARVMFIGEAPGADEDKQGEPFVGRAGKLLDRIIAACGWRREELYICNILRCRPPGNRNPSKEEANNCRQYLDGQIQIVDPDYIVCWGTIAAQNLLDVMDPIGKLRSQWFKYGRAKVLCTYHPSYLLRNESAKKPVWEDMKMLLAEMGVQPPQSQENTEA